MNITKNRISLSVEEAFDYLYLKDQRVWIEAVDLIAEYAEESFQEHYEDEPDLDSPTSNGINYSNDEEAIYFEFWVNSRGILCPFFLHKHSLAS